MATITFEHIGKIYDKTGSYAVKDFNLKIEDEEFVVLVGPSGCGKSTTLRMIAGLEEISEGRLYIGDRLVNGVEPKDRDIAMVFQSYALYPHMSVYDNMAFGLKLRKMSKKEIDRKVREAAEILGITEYLGRKPKALSGGQRQRVALGRAIVRDPAVFLMDEPLSNLDAKLRVSTRAEIMKLYHKLKTTFVYVTHDQTEAMTMGSRIVVMKDGVIQQADTPARLYAAPVNRFVAQFIGSPQMNIWKADLERRPDGACARMWGCELEIEPKRAAMIDGGVNQVLLGLRPEDIDLCGEEGIPAEVVVSEHTGAELFLIVRPEGAQDQLNLRLSSARNCRVGERVHLRLNTSKLHAFDCESERSVMHYPENLSK